QEHDPDVFGNRPHGPEGRASRARGVQPVVARRRQGQYRPVEDLHQQVRRGGQQEDGDEVSSRRARNSKDGHTAGDFPAVSVIGDAMTLLSIQSHVAYGHVGNSAAVFPLQRMGVEVWPIHTVQFSNHPGYGNWQGRGFDAGLIREVIGGIEQRGVLGTCDGVLSGYMGGADVGAAILDAVAAVKRANPAARYACDPVIGGAGRGIFVARGIPEFMKERAVPAADIITPNQFELDYLAGCESRTLADVLAAVKVMHGLGPPGVLSTSPYTEDTPEPAS